MAYPQATTPSRDQLFAAYALPDRTQPRVRVNMISSADGAGTFSGRSGGLGGPTDRSLLHVLRTMADCVVVGAGTVRTEGYGGLGLSDEDVAWRRERELPDHPQLAVVTNRLDLSPDDEVFSRADMTPIIATNAAAPLERMTSLCGIADVTICGDDKVDVPTLVEDLVERELPQILCEGGPHLFGSLLEADLVDEVCVTLSPVFTAGDASRIAASSEQLERRFDLAGVMADADGFVFLRYVRG